MKQKHLYALLFLFMCALCAPTQAFAEDSDPWASMMPTDRPGFADSATAISPERVVVEFGITGEKPAGIDFAGGMNLTLRYGIFEGLEGRARVPGLKFLLVPGANDSSSLELGMDSIDVGFKWSLPLSGIFTLAIIPYLVIPPGDGNVTPFSGVGAGSSVVATLTPFGSLFITAFATPKYLQYKTPTGSESGFELDTSLQVGGNLTREFGVFGEFIFIVPGAPGGESYAGTDFGFSYYFTPDIMMDMSAGLFFQDTLAAFGSLGISFRI